MYSQAIESARESAKLQRTQIYSEGKDYKYYWVKTTVYLVVIVNIYINI